jgi:hypothetical protein
MLCLLCSALLCCEGIHWYNDRARRHTHVHSTGPCNADSRGVSHKMQCHGILFEKCLNRGLSCLSLQRYRKYRRMAFSLLALCACFWETIQWAKGRQSKNRMVRYFCGAGSKHPWPIQHFPILFGGPFLKSCIFYYIFGWNDNYSLSSLMTFVQFICHSLFPKNLPCKQQMSIRWTLASRYRCPGIQLHNRYKLVGEVKVSFHLALVITFTHTVCALIIAA